MNNFRNIFQKIFLLKIEISIVLIVYIFISYVFTYGYLGAKNYITEGSDFIVECKSSRGGAEKLHFTKISDQKTALYSLRKYNDCEDLADKISSNYLVIYHSEGGGIGRLIVNGKVFYDSSPLVYILPYGFFLSMLIIHYYRKLGKNRKR